jgi:hypothetical protein
LTKPEFLTAITYSLSASSKALRALVLDVLLETSQLPKQGLKY